jgi:K+-transporting ATPase ATPase C chain
MGSFLRTQIRPAVAILVLLTLITGFAYPAVVTGIAQVAFPSQANGSFITVDGATVGSTLIGQSFDDPKYLWGRPSSAGKDGYDGTSSAGSNLGPTSKALIDRITASVDDMRAKNGGGPVPVELVTASGSGLDPDISPEYAAQQVDRVARERGLSAAKVRTLVDAYTDGRSLGFLGEAHVNVLLLNLALDRLAPIHSTGTAD